MSKNQKIIYDFLTAQNAQIDSHYSAPNSCSCDIFIHFDNKYEITTMITLSFNINSKLIFTPPSDFVVLEHKL